MEAYYGEPSLYATEGDSGVAHRYPLHAEASTLEEQPEDRDLLLLSKHNELDLSIQRALIALGDYGVNADIICYRWIPSLCHQLQHQYAKIKRLEVFVQGEWHEYHSEAKQIHDKEQAVANRLCQTQVVQRLEPFLHYHDEHAHLQTTTAKRNLIMREGWQHIAKYLTLYSSSIPANHLKGPTTPTNEHDEEQMIDLTTETSKESRNNYWRQRNRCCYCKAKGHFNYACRTPHRLCHEDNAKHCAMPTHHQYRKLFDDGICSFNGVHSRLLARQQQLAGL
jgi:hypothetical protein